MLTQSVHRKDVKRRTREKEREREREIGQGWQGLVEEVILLSIRPRELRPLARQRNNSSLRREREKMREERERIAPVTSLHSAHLS